MHKFVTAAMAITAVALIGLATVIWLRGTDLLEPARAPSGPGVTLRNWRLLHHGMPIAKFEAALGPGTLLPPPRGPCAGGCGPCVEWRGKEGYAFVDLEND